MKSYINKSIFILMVVSTIVTMSLATQYTNRFDNINIEEIIKSDRLLTNYIKCLLDMGRCTPDGAELKRVLSDALITNCMSCSVRQRVAAMKIIAHITAHKPDVWKRISAKYDPQGIFSKKMGILI